MQVSNNKVVSIHYTLKNNEGAVIDESPKEQPLQYLHGYGNLIPGLEKALMGKSKEDKIDVSIPPEEAYGIRDDNNIQKVPKSQFEQGVEIKPGMQFQSQTEAGVQIFTVTSVEDDQITVDGNHPLAGETLNFNVEIAEVREATDEEIKHGHVHLPGHEHH
ncbi:MAG: peptidylprolyl isomerase [Spirochaetia bacterium]|nr:peptidylprolyl isomerase [Spirochaetia bacterium]